MFGGRALPLLLLVSVSQGAQIALSPAPSTQTTTLVDLLSTDPDYTRVLSLLQRARLIPTLNKLNGSTFFAPTNDAVSLYATYNPLWADVNEPLTDNINYLLRQQLLYHLLNYTIPSLPNDDLQVHNTLLFPNIPANPPTPPPWLPQPGGTLGGEPQRARLGPRDGQVWFGVDSQGVGGFPITKDMLFGSNGNVVGVSGVVEMPSHLADVISTHPSLTYLRSILSPAHLEQLAKADALSVFLPLNNAWDSLHPLNRLYLESEFAQDDISWIVRMHAAGEERVAWTDTFGKGRTLTTLQGSPLEVARSDNGITVAGADLLESDIYASNGVLHIVSDLLLPPGSMELTPEKYLLALNCTTFVSLLHSSELTSLINSTEGKFTILAPRDDVISVNGQETLPDKGTEELNDALKYHFIEGRWPANKLKDGMLLKTALKEDGLNGKRQVLDISVSQSLTGKDTKDITFGGAGIIGDPIEINNILIYLISRPLTPPADALETALPTLRFSSFIASIFATDMAKTLKTLPESTLLMPSNSAFEKLGLVTTYLLMPASKPDLRQVIMHHTLDGVEYIDRLRNGSEQTLKTLEGSDLRIQRLDPSGSSKGSLSVSPSGGWAGSLGIIKTDQGNILTKTGVIHEIDGLLLPRSVDLTLGKLVKAAKGGTMASLITRAGMDWVLNGTAPPENEGDEWGWEGLGGEGWTLLCPTDDAFKGVNLTRMWEDVDSLRKVVAQHLIPPSTAGTTTRSFFDKKERNRVGKVIIDTDAKARDNNNSPIDIDKALNSIYSTILSKTSSYGDLVFLHNDGDESKDIPAGYVVGIKDARGSDAQEDWARVLSWGRSTTGISSSRGSEGKAGISRGGVIAIDRLLFPFRPPWYIEYGRPFGVLVGGVLLLGGFWWVVGWFWKRDTQEATYEPIGGSEEDE